MIEITKQRFPGVHRLLRAVDIDNGIPSPETYEVHDKFRPWLNSINQIGIHMYEDDLAIFAGGEESEIAAIAARSDIHARASDMMNDYFGG